jgi:WD40 repeat protein
MRWSSDDNFVVSCAADGSLYEWHVSDGGRRANEIVIKTCAFNDVAIANNSSDANQRYL